MKSRCFSRKQKTGWSGALKATEPRNLQDQKGDSIARDSFKVAAVAIPAMTALIGTLVTVSLLAAGFRMNRGLEFYHVGVAPEIYAFAKFLSKLGPIGDYIGGLLNPLVALSALVGLIFSIRVQRETLKATRDGLREQLDQDNFFILLSNREAAIESLELKRKSNEKDEIEHVFRGRTALREILQYIDDRADKIEPEKRHLNWLKLVFRGARESSLNIEQFKIVNKHFEIPNTLNGEIGIRVGIFAILYSGNSESIIWNSKGISNQIANELLEFKKIHELNSIEELLGHIFRSTYQVLKFVHRSDFSKEKKKDLINYLRAQMSEAEFATFALTALTAIGSKSRGAAIAFNLYEKRLLSSSWARPLASYFDPTRLDNYKLATDLGYLPLSPPPPAEKSDR